MRTYKHSESAEKLVHLPAVSWRNAIGSVFGAAARLHHYRDVHTRMMREARDPLLALDVVISYLIAC